MSEAGNVEGFQRGGAAYTILNSLCLARLDHNQFDSSKKLLKFNQYDKKSIIYLTTKFINQTCSDSEKFSDAPLFIVESSD